MGLQIVLLSLILEFRRETRSKCPRTSENKNFIPVSQSGFLWWPNIPRCINRIRIVQFIRFAPDLGRICTGPPHIHNLQAIHFSLPSAFSAFSIPKPGSEGCWHGIMGTGIPKKFLYLRPRRTSNTLPTTTPGHLI